MSDPTLDEAIRDVPWRLPDKFEFQVLDRLSLMDEAAGALVLRARGSRVRSIASDVGDYLRIEFETLDGGELGGRHACEANLVSNDVDGVPIILLFFSRDGLPLEIEFIRLDGSPIEAMPSPTTFAAADLYRDRAP